MPTEATVTLNIHSLLGNAFDARRTRIWLTTNVASGVISDPTGDQLRLGGDHVSLDGDAGTASFTTWVPDASLNPASWQTTIHVDYPDAGTKTRQQATFGPFTITADADLADLIEEQAVPAEYLTQVTTQLQGYVDEAEAAADAAAASAGVLTEDAGDPGFYLIGA